MEIDKCMNSKTYVKATTRAHQFVASRRKPSHDGETQLPPRLRCELQVSNKHIPQSRPKLQMHFVSSEADQIYASHCLMMYLNTIPCLRTWVPAHQVLLIGVWFRAYPASWFQACSGDAGQIHRMLMFDRSVYITMTQCFLIVSVLQRPTRKFAAKDFYALKKTCKVHSSQYKYMGKYYLESLCHRSLRWKYSLVRLTSGGDMMKSFLSNDCHPVGPSTFSVTSHTMFAARQPTATHQMLAAGRSIRPVATLVWPRLAQDRLHPFDSWSFTGFLIVQYG